MTPTLTETQLLDLLRSDSSWESQSAHSWPRRPERWDRARVNDLFLHLADLQRTAAQDPQIAEELATRLASLLRVGVAALVRRLLPDAVKRLVEDIAHETVARRIALELPAAVEMAVEQEVAMRGGL